MTKAELLRRLKSGEWDDLEFKESQSMLPKDIWKSVSAFANTEGGYIVFGVKENEDKSYVITGVRALDKVQNDFLSGLRGEKFSVPLASKGFVHSVDGKKVVVFRIDEMPRQAKPIYYGANPHNTFIRLGGTTILSYRSRDVVIR